DYYCDSWDSSGTLF
nr:immunoglobulin light chain junction region [Macaca mulatta]MOX82301.1 immunoglobulin light chain junction region [Macaca mulatta]